jgi:predicted kinase
LGRGVSVINSSGFFSEESRVSVQKLAELNDVPFFGLWL